jgi:hypothetical protein
MQKTVALRGHIEERVKQGDTKYSDSLELMIFLANLVGSEHIERFIPLADPQTERPLTSAPADDTVRTPADSVTGTREMPKFLGSKRMPPAAGSAQVARTERKPAVPGRPSARALNKQPPRLGTTVKATAAPKPAAKPAPKVAPAVPVGGEGPSDIARAQVVADAARLVQWGRKWYELPELIARMADRPSLPEVRRILKENKKAIDAKVGGA